jgi:hypothetical protein
VISSHNNIVQRIGTAVDRQVDAGQASFAEDGFQLVRKFLWVEDLSRTLDLLAPEIRSGRPSHGNGTVRGAYCIYSPEGTNYLLNKLAPNVSELVGSSLLPTYSYVQIYENGGILPLHVDSPECEVTVTITLDYSAKALWPLFLITDKVITATLDKGDAFLFDATRFLHCRRAFEGQSWTQATLHYVHANGTHATCR